MENIHRLCFFVKDKNTFWATNTPVFPNPEPVELYVSLGERDNLDCNIRANPTKVTLTWKYRAKGAQVVCSTGRCFLCVVGLK